MPADAHIPRKLTVRAHGRRLVLVKRPGESMRHVLMKAGLWALLLPEHPELTVERGIGDRFKPDLCELDADGRPLLWAEAGAVSPQKITSLARRFREARFVLAKWGSHGLDAHEQVARRALRALKRPPWFELWGMPDEAGQIVDDGQVVIAWSDVTRRILQPAN